MADEPENIVLEYLRLMPGTLDEMRLDLRELKQRMGRVEVNLERVPRMRSRIREKNSLQFNKLEHVLIQKVEQLFGNML